MKPSPTSKPVASTSPISRFTATKRCGCVYERPRLRSWTKPYGSRRRRSLRLPIVPRSLHLRLLLAHLLPAGRLRLNSHRRPPSVLLPPVHLPWHSPRRPIPPAPPANNLRPSNKRRPTISAVLSIKHNNKTTPPARASTPPSYYNN